MFHKAFGDGLIVSVKPMGGDARSEIAFDQKGTKRLMANRPDSLCTKFEIDYKKEILYENLLLYRCLQHTLGAEIKLLIFSFYPAFIQRQRCLVAENNPFPNQMQIYRNIFRIPIQKTKNISPE